MKTLADHQNIKRDMLKVKCLDNLNKKRHLWFFIVEFIRRRFREIVEGNVATSQLELLSVRTFA